MREPKILRLRGLGFLLATATLALDQLSKWLILNVIMKPPFFIELTPVLNLVLGYNRGVSFGMLRSDSEIGRWLLSALAILIICALTIWLLRVDKIRLSIALGLIIGGAIGNVTDRIMIGAVVDFIDLHLGGFHWPAFNVADMAITIGAAILILDTIFDYKSDGKTDGR
ncbi:MAG: signal peptidase II [Magnetovibrio sp.]|nr:signal peptidase II [Magnetovibrio sp.]|tara:strand:+ start:118 stop:624 length:507 start_codon:yes stop_codon:yes gene_type:complete